MRCKIKLEILLLPLTVSNPLPLSILSVVAAMFPPFLWRSHIMDRLGTCGNICCILSTSASRARILFALEMELDDRVEGFEKKSQRMTRPPRSRTRRTCGILIVCSSAILPEMGSAELKTQISCSVREIECFSEARYF